MRRRRIIFWYRRAAPVRLSDPEGISLFLVPRDAPGVTLFPYPTQSGGRAADLQLERRVRGGR